MIQQLDTVSGILCCDQIHFLQCSENHIIHFQDFLCINSRLLIDDQRSFHCDSGISALKGLNQYHVRFPVYIWVNQLHSLRFQLVLRQHIHNFRKPEGPVHHIKTAPVPQKLSSLAYHILKGAQNLMSGNCLGHMRIGQPMLADHIRRIACHNMKRSCPENAGSLFDIALSDTDPVLQVIVFHTSCRHFGTFFLNLQTSEMLSWCLGCKEHRDDPGSGSHIKNLLPFLHSGKSR